MPKHILLLLLLASCLALLSVLPLAAAADRESDEDNDNDNDKDNDDDNDEKQDPEENRFTCEVDYGKGRGSWETLWSEEEKRWCCTHRGLACPTTSKLLFDCNAGLKNWKIGWSQAKKSWCCRQAGTGCYDNDANSKATAAAAATDEQNPVQELTDEEGAEREAAAVVRGAETEQCGVSGLLSEDGSFERSSSLQPSCGRQMTTNCSVSYGPMQCPAGCDFLVPNHRFVCVFECVSSEECSSSNSNRAFPDAATGMCSACAVEGCKICSKSDECKVCHPGFELTDDGSECIFSLDRKINPDGLVLKVCCVIAALIIFAFVWGCTKGPHQFEEVHRVCLEKARLHRHYCKVQEWSLRSTARVRSLYPLSSNLRKTHIVGVGLPLFYNSISFVATIALLFAMATWAVFNGSQVSHALAATERSAISLLSTAVRLPHESPALVLSPLTPCSEASAPDIMRQMSSFASRNFVMLGFMYVVTFLASLWHGRRQLDAAKDYDARNRTMADYALRASGLKPRLTDERELKQAFEDAFKEAIGDTPGNKGFEVVGVSICYNYRHVWSDVNQMTDRLMERVELEHQDETTAGLPRGQEVAAQISFEHTTAWDEDGQQEQIAKDRAQAQRWFADDGGDEKLNSTGEAFVVFRHHGDMNLVFDRKADVSEKLQSLAAEDFSVELNKVFSEPPSINWWHLSVGDSERKQNVQIAMVKILGLITLVQLCIVYPYAHFIVAPYSAIGTNASGTKMQIAGMILGNVNMLVGLQIFFTSYGLGFHRKDGMDMMILISNTAFTMVNTLVNIGLTAFMAFSQNDAGYGPEILVGLQSLVAIGIEGDLAESMYNLLMPGTFFVGYLMFILMAGVLPFVWNTILMKIIYIWRCLPDSLLLCFKMFLPWAQDLSLEHYPFRMAEKGLEPMEIGISWDYTTIIVTPTVCFSMLCFVSPFVWQTFAMMFASNIFFFGFCRYLHFRFCKTCFYTTNRLDTMANFLWGIPLSTIAMAWCVWGFRSGFILPGAAIGVKALVIAAVFTVSFFAWILTYWAVLDPFRQRDAEEQNESTYERCQDDLLYTWFNCNPVFALKCEYFWKQADSRSNDEAAALKVNILEAKSIRKSDWLPTAKSEPRCVCQVSNKPHAQVETSTHSSAYNPKWDFTGAIRDYSDGDTLTFSVFEKDLLRKDQCIGSATLSAEQVRSGFEGELSLENCRSSHQECLLRVKVEPPKAALPQTALHITGASGLLIREDATSDSKTQKKKHGHSRERSPDDPSSRGNKTKTGPYCVCHVEERPEVRVVTDGAEDSANPKWDVRTGLHLEEGDVLVFTVLDKEEVRADNVLGTARLSAEHVMRGFKGELTLERAGKENAKLKISVRPPPRTSSVVSKPSSKIPHPVASGPSNHEPAQSEGEAPRVKFFEVGKEYLFMNPSKISLVRKDLYDNLEIETWLELLFQLFGNLPSLCRPGQACEVPGITHSTSRDVLLKTKAPMSP